IGIARGVGAQVRGSRRRFPSWLRPRRPPPASIADLPDGLFGLLFEPTLEAAAPRRGTRCKTADPSGLHPACREERRKAGNTSSLTRLATRPQIEYEGCEPRRPCVYWQVWSDRLKEELGLANEPVAVTFPPAPAAGDPVHHGKASVCQALKRAR